MSTNKDEVLNENAQENNDQTENAVENNAENTAETGNNGTPEGKIAELEAKLAEANDKHLRLYSEFDNFRKRNAKEKIDLIKTAGEDVFKTVLPVIDDFERAIKANEGATDLAALSEGFQLIYNKFKSTLKQKGLEEMESIGKPFDADLMEAITSIPAPDEDLKGKVVDEIEKGYSLHGKVIRFAKVIIGS
ncbi:MAG: GrpE protein [Bacteroidetes bacterium]|jgi:molecular chaperone GrpE|nr:GrpE protein [Bacteroidota bacterium]